MKKNTKNSAKKAVKSPKKAITLPRLKAAVQALANRYARERDCFGDSGTTCISCGEWKDFESLDGGHFIPTTYSSTRFDERNINAQCTRCNRFLHGDPRRYFRGMEKKYGRDVVDDLEARAGPYKWTREELESLRSYYRGKLNDIKAGKDPRDYEFTSVDDVFSSR